MDKVRAFPGGIHPHEGKGGKKTTGSLPITVAPVPSRVAIPLRQNIGGACRPAVAVGDHVKIGQVIGEPVGAMCAAIHASVAGTVIGIQNVVLANGTSELAVVIDNDFSEEKVEFVPVENPEGMSKQELCDLCRNKGLVGLGGATFPTSVKLNVPEGKTVDTLILNGAECEPYLSADHRLMVEHPLEIVLGALYIKNALGIPRVIIGVENNKPDAIAALGQVCRDREGFQVQGLPARYPQGGEKQLVYALTGRKVKAGGLPLDVGAIVCNVGSCFALYEAAVLGKPVYERVVTVGGLMKEPANYLARIGSPVEWLIDTSKGMLPEAQMLIYGGLMMGLAISREDIPVTKGCSGILALEKTEASAQEGACIRCGRCVEACPMKLQPTLIDRYTRKDLYEEAEKLNVLSCLECGSCSYVCPARRNICQSCKVAKKVINARKKAASAAKKGE